MASEVGACGSPLSSAWGLVPQNEAPQTSPVLSLPRPSRSASAGGNALVCSRPGSTAATAVSEPASPSVPPSERFRREGPEFSVFCGSKSCLIFPASSLLVLLPESHVDENV